MQLMCTLCFFLEDDFWFILVIDVDTIHILANLAVLGYYAVSSGNFVPTFRDNLSVPTSGFKS
jgi:hypothetical protein